ncbi:hypothetical protein ABT390_11220 [Streptomyces aurantiacus]|uniref:Uncharacterized protein n=1 Tax=Streptomyces aurantiacus JA 4570 TaxID=1286094 RepID=S3ZRG1_9ACTN|nr:hypothetical protein [Streptomyces aurantiacus]EPH45986.1 hypothetical protein STRAU_0941 [Streptomyces aurantiacus JA 4570]
MRIVEAVVGAVGSVGAVGAVMVLGAAAPAAAAEESSGDRPSVTSLVAQESFDGVPGRGIVDGSVARSLPIDGLPVP